MNAAYEVADNMLLRFGAAKVMARPLLGNLAPSITGFSAPTTAGATSGGSITMGNPKLEPFRAINLRPQLRMVLRAGRLISAAVFDKDISSFPQTVVSSGTLSHPRRRSIDQLRAITGSRRRAPRPRSSRR
jgi:iron complex outermembrane receptor protein